MMAAAMNKLLAALLIALAAAPAQALFDDNEARRAILDLRQRFERQDTDLSNRLRALESRVNQIQATASGQLALQQEIESLRGELARLRGQLEEQGNTVARLQREQKAQFANVDSRIKTVEPVTVEINGQTVQVERTEQRLFDAALNEFRGGDFAAAERGFEQFRQLFPDSPYGVEAMFWLGSSQYALKKYKEAVATQAALVDRFADNPRAADALLNKGFAEIELGRKESARKSFELVQQRYPGTTAAQSAAQRVGTL